MRDFDYYIWLATIVNEEAFYGVKDKSGVPYEFHGLRVASKLEDPEEKVIALLHDVLEDSSFTKKDLYDLGFKRSTVEAVVVITKRKYESYENYINRLIKTGNKKVLHVKLADMEDNKSEDRLVNLDEKERVKLRMKYSKFYPKILESSK